MAVFLFDLVENLKREVNPPGGSLFPDATDEEYEGHLIDAFWELTLAGFISGFTEEFGVITEDVATPVTNLPRKLQQLCVLTGGMRIIRIKLIDLDTLFRTVAGPAEFETRKSAAALEAVLIDLRRRLNGIVATLDSVNTVGDITYNDIVSLRGESAIPDYSIFIGY